MNSKLRIPLCWKEERFKNRLGEILQNPAFEVSAMSFAGKVSKAHVDLPHSKAAMYLNAAWSGEQLVGGRIDYLVPAWPPRLVRGSTPSISSVHSPEEAKVLRRCCFVGERPDWGDDTAVLAELDRNGAIHGLWYFVRGCLLQMSLEGDEYWDVVHDLLGIADWPLLFADVVPPFGKQSHSSGYAASTWGAKQNRADIADGLSGALKDLRRLFPTTDYTSYDKRLQKFHARR